MGQKGFSLTPESEFLKIADYLKNNRSTDIANYFILDSDGNEVAFEPTRKLTTFKNNCVFLIHKGIIIIFFLQLIINIEREINS